MEQINRIELRGVVGMVRSQIVENAKVYHFTVATNRAYKDRSGMAVIETTWHQVTTWDKNDGTNEGLDHLDRGSKVYLTGRLKLDKYVGNDEIERQRCEVITNRVVVLDGPEQLEYEF